jgi:hypothetical protein
VIDKIYTKQIQDFMEKSLSRQPNSAGAAPDSGVDVSLQVNYDSFINKAKQIPQKGTNAVQHAQELLLTGQLDNLENARKAAEEITEFGI